MDLEGVQKEKVALLHAYLVLPVEMASFPGAGVSKKKKEKGEKADTEKRTVFFPSVKMVEVLKQLLLPHAFTQKTSLFKMLRSSDPRSSRVISVWILLRASRHKVKAQKESPQPE